MTPDRASTPALDEVLRRLRDHGVAAQPRDWALGSTVVVPGGMSTDIHGIVVWERVVWVVDDGALSVVHPNLGVIARRLSVDEALRVALVVLGDRAEVLQRAARRVRVVYGFIRPPRACVVFDLLDPGAALSIDAGATLDGCPLEPWLERPRAIGPDGQPRQDRYAVALRDASDLARFEADQVLVILSGAARAAAALPPR